MNLPNKLTVFRICLSPIFLIALLWESLPHHYMIALIIFAIASITDMIDGYIARKFNLITDFGKFLDPLADKVLVSCAMVGMVELGLISSWFCVITLAREFIVSSIRLTAAGNGKVIAANYWGKVKTVMQMISIIVILFLQEILYIVFGFISQFTSIFLPYINIAYTAADWVGFVLMFITAVATCISGFIYVKDNAKFIKTK